MPILIDFKRNPKGGRRGGSGVASDIYVSQVDGGDESRSKSVSIRLCRTVLDLLRWIVGDFVVATCEVEDDMRSCVWTLKRVTGPKDGGCKLSGQGKHIGHASVRFTLPADVIDTLFPGGAKGFDGELIESEGAAAKFLVRFK
jgi:hypothetical protein